MRKHEVIALKTGIAIPFLYFGSLVTAALFHPGFSFVRQFASELGAEGAPHPRILNVGIILVGVACLIATFGYRCALNCLGAKPIPARLICLLIGMFGVAILMAGIFPIPNYLMHSGFGFSMPIMIGPMLLGDGVEESERPATAPKLPSLHERSHGRFSRLLSQHHPHEDCRTWSVALLHRRNSLDWCERVRTLSPCVKHVA